MRSPTFDAGTLDRHDLAYCQRLLARGSQSFAFAARLLPANARDAIAAFYAFCRDSDDRVDQNAHSLEAVERLSERLDAVYRGEPEDNPVDRALHWLTVAHALPRAPLDALIEGYAWDARGRRYRTLSDLVAYAVRVAGSVGVATSWILGRRERHVLARAVDLGVAMQLTNVARDVGEDARIGRIYLPLDWLDFDERETSAFLAAPSPTPTIRDATRRLLDHADILYLRAEAGIVALPTEARAAVRAAARIYREIGEILRARGCDGVTGRAATSRGTKVRLAASALIDEARLSLRRTEDEASWAAPLDEAAGLVESVAPRSNHARR